MSEPLPIDPNRAADLLGIHRWQLAAMLHNAAADEFRSLASSTYAGHDIDEYRIERAMRLHAAAVACVEDDDDDLALEDSTAGGAE